MFVSRKEFEELASKVNRLESEVEKATQYTYFEDLQKTTDPTLMGFNRWEYHKVSYSELISLLLIHLKIELKHTPSFKERHDLVKVKK